MSRFELHFSRRDALALLIAAPWLAFVTLRLSGVTTPWPLTLFLAFTPLVLATMIVPLVAAALLRAIWAAAAVLLAAVLLALMVVPRTIANDRPEGGKHAVTLMTANLLKGEAGPDRVVQIARSRNVDILALQEVTPEALAAIETRLGRRMDYMIDRAAPGVHGMALLSRERIALRPGSELDDWPEAIVPALGLEVLSVHPVPPVTRIGHAHWQQKLAAMPSARPASTGTARVLIGDFNATLDQPQLRDLIARGYIDAADTLGKGLRPTWSADRLRRLTIDHVLVDDRVRVESYEVLDMPGSDHDAVVVRIKAP